MSFIWRKTSFYVKIYNKFNNLGGYMNSVLKKRIILISIIMLLLCSIGILVGFLAYKPIDNVKAETYNYGEFNEKGYYTLNGVVFYAVKVKIDKEASQGTGEYWPTYEILTKDNGEYEYIKFGETVLLKDDEVILISFARQNGADEGLIIDEDGNVISKPVDFLNSKVTINGESLDNEVENNVTINDGASIVKEFGYIIDVNNILNDINIGNLGVFGGKEGKVVFSTGDYEVDSILQSYSFMFYAFNYNSYHRLESLDETAPFEIADRPNTEIFDYSNYVTDSATRNTYFAEYFYYYNQSDSLPYLRFDITKYEVTITKSIHRTSTIYKFFNDSSITNSNQTVNNKKITNSTYSIANNNFVQNIEQQISTMDIYARKLRVEIEKDEEGKQTGFVKIYFDNLGDYEIEYKAIYYNNNQKIYLENLNTDTRKDSLKIFGTELTYQDGNLGQLPLRNENNTIYGDVTGIINFINEEQSGETENTFISNKLGQAKLNINPDITIASTNQPPLKFIYNTPISSNFEVYYSTDGTNFNKDESYSYLSNLQNPGYYFVKIISTNDGFKSWVETSNTSKNETKETVQYYLFQIKELTSNLNLFKLDEEGNIVENEAERERIYNDSFVNNGIQIIEFAKANEFDTQIYFELNIKRYNETSSQSITLILPNEDYDELTEEQKNNLMLYGIEKFDGYYIIKPREGIIVDGEYNLSLKFGKSGKETIKFKLDTEEISGISLYSAESVYGSIYYNVNKIGKQGEIGLTNKAFTVFWNNKKSGAGITAKFVRFVLTDRLYSENDYEYIFNESWLANDYTFEITESTPETIFTKASEISKVESNSVLSYSGLYIFMLEDEAGNYAYYSVVCDTSPSIVLQKSTNSADQFKKVVGVNNVTEETTIFFGSHKAISLTYNNNLIDISFINSLNLNLKAANYIKEFFENLNKIDGANVVGKNNADNKLYIAIPIVSIFETAGQTSVRLDDEIIAQGYYVRKVPLDENLRMEDRTYYYNIFDKSNLSATTPTFTHKLRFNTDQSGLLIYTQSNNPSSNLDIYNSQTADDNSFKNNYYNPSTANIIYLSWESLRPSEINAYVDIENEGLVCLFYPLIYDKSKNSYVYSEVPINIDLGLETLTEDQIAQGYLQDKVFVEIPINVIDGKTQQGKYVIIRKYSPIPPEVELGNLGYDYEEVQTIVFVDRNEIISANNSDEERTGYYTFITTFDGENSEVKEFYNELFRQSQTSNNYILQTNQLPLGFYIPVSKYGTVYDNINNIVGESSLNLNQVQNSNLQDIKFIDLISFNNLDVNEELGLTSTFSPFVLNVVLVSPQTAKKDNKEQNIIYYYNYNSESGYYLISGYSVGELALDENPTPITEYSTFIKSNPILNNAQYISGNYTLKIGAIKNYLTNNYDQNFKVIVNVNINSPDYNLTAQYTDLPNLENKEVLNDGINYYTNSNELVITWDEKSNQYLTNIDLSKISIVYYKGSSQTVIPSTNQKILVYDVLGDSYYTFGENGEEIFVLKEDINNEIYVLKITKNDKNYNLVLNFDNDVTKVNIKMSFETYSRDLVNNYRKFYGNLYQSEKNIIIDRIASTNSITNASKTGLMDLDKTIEGILISQIRSSSDTRYSKSATTGIFKYYTFIASENFIINLSKTLKNNSSLETKIFYYRDFNNKYTTAAYKETGLGFDSTAKADNIFSEYFAENTGWIKVTDEINPEFKFSGYYEIIEIDLAGNQTVYSIYIGDYRNYEINFEKSNEKEFINTNVSIEKDIDNQQINATIRNSNSTNIIFLNNISQTNSIIIDSFNNLKINNINFENAYEDYDYYKYLKIIIDDEIFYITPDNFSNNGVEIICDSLMSSNGEKILFNDLNLNARNDSHDIIFIDTINTINSQPYSYSVQGNVIDSSHKLTDNNGVIIQSDVSNIKDDNNEVVKENLSLIVTTSLDSSLYIDENSIMIFKINGNNQINHKTYKFTDGQIKKYSPAVSSNSKIIYYYLPAESDFARCTFYILFKDNFGREYKMLVEYKSETFNRYEGEFDITSEMQQSNDILVSGNIAVNISNLYTVTITDNNGADVSGQYNVIDSSYLGASYSQYQLFASTEIKNNYYGDKRIFKLVLTYKIPDEIIAESQDFGYTEDESGVLETILVTIYNKIPNIKITNQNGDNITEELLNKLITQSEPITISFGTLDESITTNYTTKVFLRNRDKNEEYYEITSPHTVSEIGVYDVYLQNFDNNGNALDFVKSYDFIISDLDVMFYTVVKTNDEGNQEVVNPTGELYEYATGKFASHHYIVNTSQWDVITNGLNVSKGKIFQQNNTTVYEITSNAGTIYKTTIAITVVSKTNNILVSNPFIYYLGTVYNVPSSENYINSTNKSIYLCKDDIFNEITLQFASYYGIYQNKIKCYISVDNGETWHLSQGNNNGTVTTIIIDESSNMMFRFEDLAGNVQIFSSSTGYPSTTTTVNFIRSVIVNINGKYPIDNAIYNGNVVVTLPLNTSHFYSTTPIIKVYRNDELYSITQNGSGTYTFTQSGSYRISFSAKVEGGTRELNEDEIKFTIINENDSRWVFNYVNYNNYNILSIKYNGEELSQILKDRILSIPNEINLSIFEEDVLGNKWFNNGVYTFTLESVDPTMGSQTFEFSFWLNNVTPPISISLPEGQSTTGEIRIEFNRKNLYDALGDCYIQINNQKVYEINEETSNQSNSAHVLSNIGSYYIQIYTDSGKLVYSYRVTITEPLNTVTIILIVVSVVVVAVGLLIFFLLRKKMQVR